MKKEICVKDLSFDGEVLELIEFLTACRLDLIMDDDFTDNCQVIVNGCDNDLRAVFYWSIDND